MVAKLPQDKKTPQDFSGIFKLEDSFIIREVQTLNLGASISMTGSNLRLEPRGERGSQSVYLFNLKFSHY